MKTAWMSCLLALLMTLPLRAEQMQELGPGKCTTARSNSSFLTPGSQDLWPGAQPL